MKIVSTSIVKCAWRGLVPALLVVALSLGVVHEAGAQGMKKITMFLDWDGRAAQHLGFLLAKDKGWFAAEGLDVRIVPGRGSGMVAQVVVGGRAEIGEMSSAVLVQSVGKQNAPLISVAVFHQKDNMSMVFYEDSGIRKPKDIEGKKYGIVPGSVAQLLWPAFAQATGIDLDKVTVIKTSFQLYIPQFMKRQFPITGNYVVGSFTSAVLEKGGSKTRQFVFSDYLPILGQAVVVRKDLLANNPKMVKGFLRAMGKAWKAIDTDPDKAVLQASNVASKLFGKGLSGPTIAKFARITIPSFMRSPSNKGKPIGWSRTQDWQAMIDMMAKVDKFPKKPKVADVMTNRFYQ